MLELEQRFKQLTGAVLRAGNSAFRIPDGKVAGKNISFFLLDDARNGRVAYRFTGRVVGTTLQGTFESAGGGEHRWWAMRFQR